MKEVLDTVVGIVFGVTPSQMSLLFFLHYLHCSGGWSIVVDSSVKGHAQEWRIKVNQNLELRLGDKFNCETIKQMQNLSGPKGTMFQQNIKWVLTRCFKYSSNWGKKTVF